MGGGTFGNVTAAAEYNTYADPEAADIVFRSGAQVTMCGLDLTHQVVVDDELVAQCAALYDRCAVLAVTHPELFTFADRSVSSSSMARTRVTRLIDLREWMSGPVRVAERIDAVAALATIVDAISAAR
jgi:inosine-uridine nucleoside N-ribohydrolase